MFSLTAKLNTFSKVVGLVHILVSSAFVSFIFEFSLSIQTDKDFDRTILVALCFLDHYIDFIWNVHSYFKHIYMNNKWLFMLLFSLFSSVHLWFYSVITWNKLMPKEKKLHFENKKYIYNKYIKWNVESTIFYWWKMMWEILYADEILL